MKTTNEIENKIQKFQEQKEFFNSLEPDIQTVNLNVSRINLIEAQIELLNWILSNNTNDLKERMVQALEDFGVGNEMYDDSNDKLADYLIEVIEELH